MCNGWFDEPPTEDGSQLEEGTIVIITFPVVAAAADQTLGVAVEGRRNIYELVEMVATFNNSRRKKKEKPTASQKH